MRWMVKAGTQCRVTAEITPSAPRPTRAASSSSPSPISMTPPEAVTSRTPVTREERFPKRAPVPCVAVEMAPAMVCGSTSPWFSSASPWRASAGPSSRIVIPASTVTCSPSTASTRSRPERSTITPSVQAMSEKECPEPATLTLGEPATIRISSASVRGRITRSGAQR